MSKIFKIASAGLGVLAIIMMFLPQVIVHWADGTSDTLAVNAFFSGTFANAGTNYYSVGSGLAGYILVGVAALLVLACAFLDFFKDHDVMNYIALGAAIICALIGIILIFMIRRNFDSANAISAIKDSAYVSMGAGAIIGGIAATLSGLSAGISLVIDIAK